MVCLAIRRLAVLILVTTLAYLRSFHYGRLTRPVVNPPRLCFFLSHCNWTLSSCCNAVQLVRWQQRKRRRVHGMSCRSIHVTLHYRWLSSMHTWRPIYFPSRAGPRRICDLYDFFAPHINVLTYLLTYSKWRLGVYSHKVRERGRFCRQNWLPRQRPLRDQTVTSYRSSASKVLPTLQISWRSVL